MAARAGLEQQLRGGRYGKPFLVDDGRSRRLHFGLDYVQSEMDLGQPAALALRYTRAMMAFLLFLPDPRHIVVVGLGGGSLTKFCHRRLPQARVTTVEIDADVIAFGGLFDLPAPDARMRLLHADACDYFAGDAAPADVVLLDGCDRNGSAASLCSARFYRDVRARLRRFGMAVANITGSPARAAEHLRLIAGVFDGHVLVIDLPDCGNRVAFAFNDPRASPDEAALARRAAELTHRHELDFHEFEFALRRAWRQRRRRW